MIPTPFFFLNWGQGRLQLGQQAQAERSSAAGSLACPPAESKAQEGAGSKELPIPHCHHILKGQAPGDKLEGDSCFG